MTMPGVAARFTDPGVARNPFRDTIDPEMFFSTRQHEEAVIKLRCGIEDGHALILLTGPSGTGKTLVSRVVLRNLESSRHQPLVVSVPPGMGKGGLLEALLLKMRLADPPRRTTRRLALIQEAALARYRQGKRLVVVIDEAHFLQAEALHLLRTLSNLETESAKLVTVVLISEESLPRRLRHPSYASLRGRITFAVRLAAMSRPEMEQMIKYRLLKCQAPPGLVREDAYQRIFALSRGLPRETNRLLYNACLEIRAADLPEIDAAAVDRAARGLV